MPETQTPIISDFAAYAEFPSFGAISAPAVALMTEANTLLARTHRTRFATVLRMMDCYLQITNQNVSLETFGDTRFPDLYCCFVGAINSDRFIDRTSGWRYSITCAFNALAVGIREQLRLPAISTCHPGTGALTDQIGACVDQFNSLPLDDEKVWLWRGWISRNRSGHIVCQHLYPVYARMGRDFTNKLFEACDAYIAARRQRNFSWIKRLAEFIGAYEEKFNRYDLLDSQFATRFWRDFYNFYFVRGFADGKGASISSLQAEWNKNVPFFISEALQMGGIFAAPWGELPGHRDAQTYGAQTHVRRTLGGFEVQTKLLTSIPLAVSDKQALELLFYQIEADINVFVHWAEHAAADLWQRYQRQKELAPRGIVRTIQTVGGGRRGRVNGWLTDRKNPDHLQNAAATLNHYGFLTKADQNIFVLFPLPISQTAHELGLPVTDALLPHCILLVADHPSITPAFLEQFELFDKNGKQTGFTETDRGCVLTGYKHRSGPQHAQKAILLSERATKIVRQVIEITGPLRRYLKDKGDDNWRRLLLTCAQGFSYPAPIPPLSQSTTVPQRAQLFVKRLSTTCNDGIDRRKELVEGFSIPALRASAGVLIYLRTRSAEEMSEALGHAKYDPRLLSRYLPASILDFFQERWVRLFQTGIIVEALRDSTYLLDAAQLKDMNELHEFLSHHALRVLPEAHERPECFPGEVKREVAFGLNISILTTMLSLASAVRTSIRQVSARAAYWAKVTDRLVAYLDSELASRDDLQHFLAVAREKSDPSLMQSLIYD